MNFKLIPQTQRKQYQLKDVHGRKSPPLFGIGLTVVQWLPAAIGRDQTGNEKEGGFLVDVSENSALVYSHNG